MDVNVFVSVVERLGYAAGVSFVLFKLLKWLMERMVETMEAERQSNREAINALAGVVGELRDLMMEIKGILRINGHARGD